MGLKSKHVIHVSRAPDIHSAKAAICCSSLSEQFCSRSNASTVSDFPQGCSAEAQKPPDFRTSQIPEFPIRDALPM